MDIIKSIRKLLFCKKNDKILINDKYECTIKNSRVFSTFTKSDVCPAYSSYAIVKVAGHESFAKLDVMWNLDISSELNCSLCLYDDNKDLTSMISVIDIKFL